MRKLFVSFTSALQLVAHGKISMEDLQTGLFMFGCTRDHAYNPGAAGEMDERTADTRYAKAYPVVMQALQYAERNGRALWSRTVRTRLNPWEVLDRLLLTNGLHAVSDKANHDGLSSHYSYPGVRDAVAAHQMDLEVVY